MRPAIKSIKNGRIIISLFKTRAKSPAWTKKSQDEILKMRMKDLHIPLERTGLMPYLNKLQEELNLKGLGKFRPYFWFSDEWFTPDKHTGIAIPFYLAHKKLAQIQEKLVYDVEGGTPVTFMKLLRHECGHAIDNAFKLRRKRRRQEIFGKSSEKYEDTYAPKPFSKRFVVNVNGWYAQSHPDEDFAETFAVWLNPRGSWKRKYKDWRGALKKLEYMDELMQEIQGEKPLLKTRKKVDSLPTFNKRLEDHYRECLDQLGGDLPSIFDVHLQKLFTNNQNFALDMKASTFIRTIKKEVRKSVSPWTGAYQYTLNEILDEVIERCDQLQLRLKFPVESSKNQFISMLSVATIEYIHNGSHRLTR